MQIQFRRAVFTILTMLTVLALAATSARAQTLPNYSLKQSGLTFAKSQGSQPMAASGGDEQHEGLGIGVLVGPLFDKTEEEDVDPENAFKGKTGLQFSLFLGGNRPGRVGIATEISWLRRTADNDVVINALQVPFFVRINIGSQNLDRASVYLKVGPAIDVIFSAKQGDESFKDQVEEFQIDGIVGVGVEITRFIIEGRYIQGFRSISKDADVSDIKTKAFALLFGFRFN